MLNYRMEFSSLSGFTGILRSLAGFENVRLTGVGYVITLDGRPGLVASVTWVWSAPARPARPHFPRVARHGARRLRNPAPPGTPVTIASNMVKQAVLYSTVHYLSSRHVM